MDSLIGAKSLLIVAGDTSGDLHGARLIQELKSLRPDLYVAALGGKHMSVVADRFLFDLVALGAAGFAEPILRFFVWSRLLNVVRRYLDEKKPDGVITIDFYGFNHQVLGLAKHRKIPTFYYISPQVWASRPGRIQHLAKLVEHMIVIFPFEKDIYHGAGIPCTYVGHPLLDILPQPQPATNDQRPIPFKIGILPGSRPQEIHRHMPLFLEAYRKIQKELPSVQAYVFAAPQISDDFLKPYLRNGWKSISIVRESNYQLRSELDFALTSSGTATLENALLGIPMTVAYKLPWFTYWVARSIIRVPYIAMANILAGHRLVPELIQSDAVPEKVVEESLRQIKDVQGLANLRRNLLELRRVLGDPGASQRAAQLILEKLK
ncbi:MAG: lipid-A-disaccharide synthase [Elusimicrobia bacterium]|nr:lipid-A-disaccharide synthase [Elusimicrobiota bacterium]